jgi:hypothetical protein
MANAAIQWLRLLGTAGVDIRAAREGDTPGQPGWSARITMSGDALLERIEAFNRARGGGVVVRKVARGYTVITRT